MDVFWSGTDKNTIEEISQGGWFVSTVFNKRHEMRSCINMVAPLPIGMLDNIPTRAIQFLDPEVVKKWDADYDANVTNVVQGSWYDRRAVSEDNQLSFPHETAGIGLDEESGKLDDSNHILSPSEADEYIHRLGHRAARRGSPPLNKFGRSGGW